MDAVNMPASTGGLQVFDGDNRRGYHGHHDGYNAKDANALSAFHVSERIAGENREVRLELSRKLDVNLQELANIQREQFRNFDETKRLIVEKSAEQEKFLRDIEINRLRDNINAATQENLVLKLAPTTSGCASATSGCSGTTNTVYVPCTPIDVTKAK